MSRQYEIRQARNEGTRAGASRHGESWTQDELDYLRANYTHQTVDDVAGHLRRTREACKQMFYFQPETDQNNRNQERVTTARKTPGQRRWEQGFTDLDGLDREVDFSKLGW